MMKVGESKLAESGLHEKQNSPEKVSVQVCVSFETLTENPVENDNFDDPVFFRFLQSSRLCAKNVPNARMEVPDEIIARKNTAKISLHAHSP